MKPKQPERQLLNFLCPAALKSAAVLAAAMDGRTLSNWIIHRCGEILKAQETEPEDRPEEGTDAHVNMRANAHDFRALVIKRADAWGWPMSRVVTWAMGQALAKEVLP